LAFAEAFGIPPWSMLSEAGSRVDRHGHLFGGSSREHFHVSMQNGVIDFASGWGMEMTPSFPVVDFQLDGHRDKLEEVLRQRKEHDFIVFDAPRVSEEQDEALAQSAHVFAGESGKPFIVIDHERRRGCKYPAKMHHVWVSDETGGRLAALAAQKLAAVIPEQITALAIAGSSKPKRVEVFARLARTRLPHWDIEEVYDSELLPANAEERLYDLLLRAHKAGRPYDVIFVNADWLMQALLKVLARLSETHAMPYLLGYDCLPTTLSMKGSEAIAYAVVQDPIEIGWAATNALRSSLSGEHVPGNIRVGASLWQHGTPHPAVDYKRNNLSAELREEIHLKATLAGERFERNPKDPMIKPLLEWLLSLRRQ
jgi:hypothetical protein